MRLTEILYRNVEDKWEKTLELPFIRELADGSLPDEKFWNYMVQDYLYLLGYLPLVESLRGHAKSQGREEVVTFLGQMYRETAEEMRRVHLPNLLASGISEHELSARTLGTVGREYLAYMQAQIETGNVLYGLAALLDCSWSYNFIAERMMERYSEKICASKYRSWFEAYCAEEYVSANRRLIDMVDALAEEAGVDEAPELCRIFVKCSEYEQQFWKMLYR